MANPYRRGQVAMLDGLDGTLLTIG